MRRNNFTRFDSRQFEKHLSPFGRQVLGTLIKQWSSAPVPYSATAVDRMNNPPFRQNNNSHRRVLRFGEPNIRVNNPMSYTASHALNSEAGLDDHLPFLSTNTPSAIKATMAASSPDPEFAAPSVFPAPPAFSLSAVVPAPSIRSIPEEAPVPTSAELVSTANISNEDQIRCSRDLIISVNETNVLKDTNEFVAVSDINDDGPSDNVSHEVRNSDDLFGKSHLTSNVNWDDMFDTELFSEFDSPVEDRAIAINHVNNDEVLNICFSEQTSSSLHVKRSKNNDPIDIKKPKRKNQSKVTDLIPKKVKKIKSESKSKSLSKQKNTESFQNWLNDVDPNNPVEECEETLEIEKQKSKKVKKPLEDSTKKGPPEKLLKKIVQSRLANKGGTMKFANPNKNDLEDTKEDTKTGEDIPENKVKDKDKVKEKKPKSKFVAPIKSQLPVKEVTYNVLEVNETCMKKIKSDNWMDQEITALLLYSNGFCQLNSHHTEDTCEPEAILFHLGESFFYFKKDVENAANILSNMLEKNVVICYDGKSLLSYLLSKIKLDFDTICTFTIIDVKIAGSLLEPDSQIETFSALQQLVNSETEFTIATTCMKQKAAWYATLLNNVATAVRNKLELEDLWEVFVDIEMQILPIIADMEQRGVCVDMDKLKEMEKTLMAKMKQVEMECMAAAGRSFQINSTVQVRALLYDELRLDEKAGLKVRGTLTTGAKSTSETMLKSLESVHPLPRLILEYRHLHKAHATFVQGVAQYVRGGIVRPVWVQTAAATGRIASSNPNLQAIPKVPFNLRLFAGSGENDSEALRFRCVYVARPDHVLLAADWRHVECRVFARAAADTALQRALLAPDLFRRLAADWLKKLEEQVSPEDRERTKRIVYASLYGAGPRKLMDILDVDYPQALSIAASFDRTFPSLRSFGRRVAAECLAANGRVATLCGRARTLPHIASSDAAQRSHAERQALNFIVQGSAADVCKLAMARACSALRAAGLRARLLLQIHDELVWEVARTDLAKAAEVIRESMERCGARAGLTSLPVALAAGPSWGELEPYPSTQDVRESPHQQSLTSSTG